MEDFDVLSVVLGTAITASAILWASIICLVIFSI